MAAPRDPRARPPLPVGGACACEHSGLSGTCVRYLIHVHTHTTLDAHTGGHVPTHTTPDSVPQATRTARTPTKDDRGSQALTRHGPRRHRAHGRQRQTRAPQPEPPRAHAKRPRPQPRATRTAPREPAREPPAARRSRIPSLARTGPRSSMLEHRLAVEHVGAPRRLTPHELVSPRRGPKLLVLPYSWSCRHQPRAGPARRGAGFSPFIFTFFRFIFTYLSARILSSRIYLQQHI